MKLKHAEFLAAKMNDLGQTHPVILGADFNTNPGTKAFQKFDDVADAESAYIHTRENHDNPGFGIDVQEEYRNDTPATTFKCRAGGTQPGKCQPVAQGIDFLFHSNQWQCTKTLSLGVDLYDMRNKGGVGLPNWRYPSDHLMIAAEFELPPKKPKTN